jgi:hypothetical protein
MSKDKPKSGGLASLIRNGSQLAKDAAEATAGKGNLVATKADGSSGRIFDILSFIEAPWGLQMRLWPVQRFIVKLYYNLPLDNKERSIVVTDMFRQRELYRLTEVEYLQYLYNEGRCSIKEQTNLRRNLLLSIGRRSGKTTISAAFASYELYRLISLGNPQAYYGIPNGNRIQIISIATGKDQAALLFNEVTGHIAKCEWFKSYIVNNTAGGVLFRTPYDLQKYGPVTRHQDGKFTSSNGKASLRLTFKAAISNSLRGAGNIMIILDEMAHFQAEGRSSAKDIYDSIVPSTMAFSPKDPNDSTKAIGPVEARIIGISSPLTKSGKFYDLYHFAMSNAEGSDNWIAIKAPTWEVNPTAPGEFFREKYHEDPAIFMTEFGAEFSDRVRGWIERERDLIECIEPERRPIVSGVPRSPHQMGLDVGLVGDGTTIAITHTEGDRIVLDYHEGWYAGVPWREANPHLTNPVTDYAKTLEHVERLDFDEISKWIYALSRRFYLTDGLFDRWNGIPLEQALHKIGLTQFKSEFFSRDATSRMYQTAKLLMFDKRIVLYDWPKPQLGTGKKFSPLIEELLSLQASQTARNQIVVEAPKIAGAHDDMADALIRAIWLSYERLQNQKHSARGGTPRNPQGPLGASSTQHYQIRRARSHGLFTDRVVPRGFRR